ncbi:hypothetical protein KC322_g11430, partial [Hortaea werneckii]
MNHEHCTGVLPETETCQQPSPGAQQSPQEADAQSAGDESAQEAEPNNNDDAHMSGTHKSSSSYSTFHPVILNLEAIKHVATFFLPGNHGKCLDVRDLASGSFHVVKLLDFEDGWSCVGRFAEYKEEPLRNLESEQATVRYLKKHSSIPVPEIYFVNNNPDHVVGTTFVLQERLTGQSLSKIYDDLSMDHKLAAISQMGEVIANLSRLHFPAIGSLKEHGEVGPLQNYVYDDEPSRNPTGPHHTLKDFMFSFLSTDGGQFAAARALFPAVKETLEPLLAEHAQNPILNPPWRL